jgi:hypothetical protein
MHFASSCKPVLQQRLLLQPQKLQLQKQHQLLKKL